MRNATIIGLAFLVGACVNLSDIQRQHHIRSLVFNGSYEAVAGCVQDRLRGKMATDRQGERYVIYDRVLGMSMEGLTHYSITVGHWSIDQGYAQWRIVEPKPSGPGYRKAPLADTAVRQIWAPVEDCAANARKLDQTNVRKLDQTSVSRGARVPYRADIPIDQTTFGDDYGQEPE